MILQKRMIRIFQGLCSLLLCLFSSSWVCSVIRKLPLQVQTEPVEQQTHKFLFYLKIFKLVYTINQIIWEVTVAAIWKLQGTNTNPHVHHTNTVILILKLWNTEIALVIMFLILERSPTNLYGDQYYDHPLKAQRVLFIQVIPH